MRGYPITAGLVVLLAGACSGDTSAPPTPLTPTSPWTNASRFDAAVAMSKAGKADVCHQEGNGGFHLINISAGAVAAHLKHGDATPGAAVPGDPSKKFDGTCALVDASICPCRFTVNAIQALNAQFGDLGTDYDFLSTNVVTQIFSRSNVGDRAVNRFVGFQAPGPQWPQSFVCVTRVFDPGFVPILNEELAVTPQQAASCVDDLHALGRVLGIPNVP